MPSSCVVCIIDIPCQLSGITQVHVHVKERLDMAEHCLQKSMAGLHAVMVTMASLMARICQHRDSDADAPPSHGLVISWVAAMIVHVAFSLPASSLAEFQHSQHLNISVSMTRCLATRISLEETSSSCELLMWLLAHVHSVTFASVSGADSNSRRDAKLSDFQPSCGAAVLDRLTGPTGDDDDEKFTDFQLYVLAAAHRAIGKWCPDSYFAKLYEDVQHQDCRGELLFVLDLPVYNKLSPVLAAAADSLLVLLSKGNGIFPDPTLETSDAPAGSGASPDDQSASLPDMHSVPHSAAVAEVQQWYSEWKMQLQQAEDAEHHAVSAVRKDVDRRVESIQVLQWWVDRHSRSHSPLCLHSISLPHLISSGSPNAPVSHKLFWHLDWHEIPSIRSRYRLVLNRKGHNHPGCALRTTPIATAATETHEPTISKAELEVLKRSKACANPAEDDEVSDEEWTEQPSETEGSASPGLVAEEDAATQPDSLLRDTISVALSKHKLLLSMPCDAVRLSVPTRGTLHITAHSLVFQVSHKPDDDSEDSADVLPLVDAGNNMLNLPQLADFIIPLSAFTHMHHRRHYHQPWCLEVLTDASCAIQSVLFRFSCAKEKDKVFQKIRGQRPAMLVKNPCMHRSPPKVLQKSGITQLWMQRKMTNFEYLLALNRIAGRTFNDVNQYPVFPWILSDYVSNSLDLSNHRVYRDLSKPVGALKPERLLDFQRRFTEFVHEDIPRFHYGTHYSSGHTVMWYLCRVEPFASLALQLQVCHSASWHMIVVHVILIISSLCLPVWALLSRRGGIGMSLTDFFTLWRRHGTTLGQLVM